MENTYGPTFPKILQWRKRIYFKPELRSKFKNLKKKERKKTTQNEYGYNKE